jgi:hypothetical protein
MSSKGWKHFPFLTYLIYKKNRAFVFQCPSPFGEGLGNGASNNKNVDYTQPQRGDILLKR